MNSSFASGLVRRWVAVFTRGLPAEVRFARSAEIDSDLWSQHEEAGSTGRSDRALAVQILVRLVLGTAADLTWRLERGRLADRSMERSTTMSMRIVALLAIVGGLGLTIGVAVFAVTFLANPDANPWVLVNDQPYGAVINVSGSAGLVAVCLSLGWLGLVLLNPPRESSIGLVAIVGAVGGLLGQVRAYAAMDLLPAASAVVVLYLARSHVVHWSLALIHVASAPGLVLLLAAYSNHALLGIGVGVQTRTQAAKNVPGTQIVNVERAEIVIMDRSQPPKAGSFSVSTRLAAIPTTSLGPLPRRGAPWPRPNSRRKKLGWSQRTTWALAARDLGYVSAGTCASRSSFAVSSWAWNCFFAIRARIGSPTLKNPPGSPSKAAITFVPPPSATKVLLSLNENGLSVVCTNRWLLSCSITSKVESTFRPRNLARDVMRVPTLTGVSDGVDSSTMEFHSGVLVGSSMYLNTSATGRLMCTEISNFTIGIQPPWCCLPGRASAFSVLRPLPAHCKQPTVA